MLSTLGQPLSVMRTLSGYVVARAWPPGRATASAEAIAADLAQADDWARYWVHGTATVLTFYGPALRLVLHGLAL